MSLLYPYVDCKLLLILSGPWKRKCLVESGIVTQCLAPEYGRTKLDDQYLTNLLLQINAKVCRAIWIAIFSIMHIFVFCLAGNYLNMVFFLSSFFNQLGGLNSQLQIERNRAIPLVSRNPTIIFGMDVSHSVAKKSNIPSVAAVSYILFWR